MSSYYIRAEYFYYIGTCYAPQNGALRDHAGNRLEFASREDAAAYLCGEGDGTYILRHGEYARPVYRIRKVSARRGKGAA